MALTPTDSRVIIDGEAFDLISIPSAESKLVQSAKHELLGELDLQRLVDDLGKLGTFMRVAYNGVAGNPEVQIKVRSVAVKITKLAENSGIIIHKFKRTSTEVLKKLKSTYQFLLDGQEKVAVHTLSKMTNKAEDMAKAAKKLREDFDQATNDVEKALENTMMAKGDQEDIKKTLEQKRREFENKKEKTEALEKIAQKAEEQATELYEKAQARENAAQTAQGKHDSIMQTILNSITDVVTGVPSAVGLTVLLKFEKAAEKLMEIGDKSGYKEATRRANAEKIKHLEQVQKEQERRREAIQQCIEFTQKIIDCENDSDLAQAAIDALQNSVGALKSLSATMMKVSTFWELMREHCNDLAQGDFKETVEMVTEMPKEERLQVWTSAGFKEEALCYYSKWVALNDVSRVYMLQIDKTRQKLLEYLQLNPTTEEARSEVRRLASEFADDLKQDQEKDEKESRLKETQMISSE